MKTVELRDLTVDELLDKLRELRSTLFNLRFQLATGQLDNHRRVRAVKRDVARVLTVIREQELTDAERAEAEAAAADGGDAATEESS